jgi:hypothetical protein
MCRLSDRHLSEMRGTQRKRPIRYRLMKSPFPGMDPYLEDPAVWRDFHTDFLANIRASLNAHLPQSYSAQIEEAVRLVQFDPLEQRDAIPDVTISRDPARGGSAAPHSIGGVATLEPVTLPLPELVEVRDHWVEVRHLPDRELVTVIELLSPTNKSDGREEYIAKRVALLKQPVHLVELDLLLSGKRLPMMLKLPEGDYYAIVSRVEDRPEAKVYSWMMKQPLPKVPVPLRVPDPDVWVDMAAVFQETYRRGAYERLVKYSRPPVVRMKPSDVEWATSVANSPSAIEHA